MSKIRAGVSGWSNPGWRGDYFPNDLPDERRLSFLSERMDSVEANGTFYRLLSPGAYRRWYERTAPGFVIAVKGSRFITHNKKLRDVRPALANFLASGVLELGEKLGPLLWQLPQRTRFESDRLQSFLDLLPHDTHAAARIARAHDHRVPDPSLSTDRNRRIRHVLEPRHESFFCDESVRILREAGVALAVSHSGDWPMREEITAGFVYVRLHGAPRTYVSGYDASSLDRWAARAQTWASGDEPDDAKRITSLRPPPRKSRDVYVYFDNDAEGRAPHDAESLRERLVG